MLDLGHISVYLKNTVRVLSTGGPGSFPPNVSSSPPPKKKVFPEKKIKAISNIDLI